MICKWGKGYVMTAEYAYALELPCHEAQMKMSIRPGILRNHDGYRPEIIWSHYPVIKLHYSNMQKPAIIFPCDLVTVFARQHPERQWWVDWFTKNAYWSIDEVYEHRWQCIKSIAQKNLDAIPDDDPIKQVLLMHL